MQQVLLIARLLNYVYVFCIHSVTTISQDVEVRIIKTESFITKLFIRQLCLLRWYTG